MTLLLRKGCLHSLLRCKARMHSSSLQLPSLQSALPLMAASSKGQVHLIRLYAQPYMN